MADRCPTGAVLEAFAEGRLGDHESATAEAHLAHCLACAEELERMSRAQLEILVGSGSPSNAWEPSVHPVLDRLMRQAAEGPGALDRLDPDWVSALLDRPAVEGTLGTFAGYHVLEIAGQGGMGVVLKVRDTTLDRVVALKLLKRTRAPDPCAFIEEARTVAALQHDHVVAIHHAGVEKGIAYLVMPFHAEGTLADWLRHTPKLSPREVALVGLQLARALEATHARGILHRDIKPSNILLDRGLDRVRLADFGLAQSHGAGSPDPERGDASSFELAGRTVAGTPQYMSPEQARGEAIDARSDLFSLGAVMFQMATGQALYAGESSQQILQAAARCEHKAVPELAPKLPGRLAGILDRLLAEQPGQRFASATDLAAELEQLLQRRNWIGRWARRAAIIAVTACLLMAATVITLDSLGQTALINSWLCQRTGNGYCLRGRFGTFPNLREAVVAARPHDVVEVRFSGEQVVDSFRTEGKPLIIRAAQGFQPVLVARNNTQPMILVDAPLTLEGLTLWRRGPVVNFALLISVEDAPLHLLNCRIVRSGHAGQSVLVWGKLRSIARNEKLPVAFHRALLGFQHGSSGRLRNCLVAGVHAAAVELRSSTNQPTRVHAENNLVLTDRTFFTRPDEMSHVDLQFARSILVTGGLLELDESGVTSGIAASWEDCLVDCTRGAILRVNQAREGTTLRGVKWREKNVVYAGLGAFGISRDGRQIRSETEWNRRLQLTPGSHRFIDARPFSETSVRSVLTLNSTDLDMKAVRKAGMDRAGFFAQFIGEGDPYQRFRREPAYHQWQDQVRAAVQEWEQRRTADTQSVVAR